MMQTESAARQAASSALQALFSALGDRASGADPLADSGVLGDLGGGTVGDLSEFLAMPVELAAIFSSMGGQLTELSLQVIERAGVALVEGKGED